jgi:hypothetical protein
MSVQTAVGMASVATTGFQQTWPQHHTHSSSSKVCSTCLEMEVGMACVGTAADAMLSTVAAAAPVTRCAACGHR